jgi:glycerophosphoryl diester phosphodiesterase
VTLTVAHRAGNRLDLLHSAEAAGAQYIEADVWLARGRVEVRHAEQIGRLPLLRERWRILVARRPLLLEELLGALAPGTRLLLDLKGADPRLPAAARALLEEHAPRHAYAVCSPNWALLEPFRDAPGAEVWHSVNDEPALAAVGGAVAGSARPVVTVDHRLLTAERVEALRAFAPTVVAWTVNSPARARELLRWGVGGITSDDLALLAALGDA